MATDGELLESGYAHLKAGSLYKKWAQSNPGEAAKLESYIADMVVDGVAEPPVLVTETGKGFVDWVGMFDLEEAPPPPPPILSVTSSLAAGTLTQPVVWSAIPSTTVPTVEFLIDGITKWTEHQAPYEYNGDGGKLDPAVLTNGPHVFTVVATATDGSKATASATCTVDVALPPPPPPPVGGAEGRVQFWMYGTSQVDQYVNNTSLQPFMKQHWNLLEGWLDSEAKWHPGVMRYDDSIAIYTGSTWETQHPDWILKDAQNNKLKFYSSVQWLADPGKPEYQDAKAAEVASFIAKGFKGVKLDDVNQDKVSNASAVNPRTGKVYTLPEWQKDIADLVAKIATKCRALKPDFWIAGNILYWATGPDVDRCLNTLDFAQLERGFNDPNFTPTKILQVWSFVDKLHSMGTGAIHLSEASGTQAAHFNLACALLCSNGHDYAYGEGWRPGAWDPIYDTNLGDATGPRTLVSGSLYRRDFQHGYVTADLTSKVGTVVTT